MPLSDPPSDPAGDGAAIARAAPTEGRSENIPSSSKKSQVLRSESSGTDEDHSRLRRVVRGAVIGTIAGVIAMVLLVTFWGFFTSGDRGGEAPGVAIVPVEAAEIHTRDVREIRVLSGTLQARSRSMVATRIAGRVEEMRFNIGDVVEPDAVIAVLDGAEYQQAVEEARAELRVAEASLAENESMLAISERNFQRVSRLFGEDIASESELDAARADFETKEARVRVSESQVARAEAQLRAAEVRLSYATIRAVWPDGDTPRIVGERFVDEGSTVAANGAIVSLLDIDALVTVVYVSERDYARLAIGQPARITSDSHAGEAFTGRIVRLAPEFREASRQARVEIELTNLGHRLRPGMFVRAEIELARSEGAVVIPREAIVQRRGMQGVFVVGEGSMTVRFVPVTLGIREGGMVEVIDPSPEFDGRVVTLGQHLLDDDSPVRVVSPGLPAALPPPEAEPPAAGEPPLPIQGVDPPQPEPDAQPDTSPEPEPETEPENSSEPGTPDGNAPQGVERYEAGAGQHAIPGGVS